MKWPQYPKYKPSGVEWLGEVPEHWEVKRSDTLVTTAKRQVTPDSFVDMEVMHYSIPVVQEIGTGAVENGEDIASAKQVIDGPVVLVSRLNPRKATICRAAPHEELLTLASTEFVALKPTAGDIRYLQYLVSSELFRQRLDSWAQSVTRSHQRARPEEIYRFWSAWPGTAEQRAIADFLDRETAKIDTLVAKKRTLIERLKEKRTALISRTVTRGLPPDAARAAGLDPHPKLKPSGIDWLGDVPEHWAVRRIASESTKITNGFVGPTRDILVDDGVRYLQSLHIKNNQIVFARPYFVEEEWSAEHSKSVLKVDDVLIVQTGDIGQVAVVPEEFAGANCHALIIVSPRRDRLSGAFLSLFLNSSFGFDELKRIQTGALHPHLNCGLVRDVRFPFPPLPEQLAIVTFLVRAQAEVDAMVTKVENALDRLQEYRTALITAAVTGKIDVRNQDVRDGASDAPASLS